MKWTRRALRSVAAAGLRGLALASTLCFSASAGVAAQQAALVRGRVLDAETREAIIAASVTIVDGSGTVITAAMTGADGRFVLAVLDSGTFRLRTERLGYTTEERGPLTLSVGDTLTVDVTMTPEPLLLDQILVSVRRAGRTLRAGEELLYGRLLDDSTHDPIPGGTLRLLTTAGQVAASTISSDEGLFWLVSPRPGSYRLQGERIGYKTAEGPELKLMLGDSIGLDFYLSMQAVLLNPITVTASARPWGNRAVVKGMEDFFDRYQMFGRGYGSFMTRDSIAEWEKRSATVGDMLLATMPAVRGVVPVSGLSPGGGADASGSFLGGAVILRGGRFFGGKLQTHCIPTYYLNDVAVPYEVVSEYRPGDLEGVELYVSPNVPGQFNAGFPCGVVVYWARRSPGTRSFAGPTFRTGALVGMLVALTFLLIR